MFVISVNCKFFSYFEIKLNLGSNFKNVKFFLFKILEKKKRKCGVLGFIDCIFKTIIRVI